MNKKAALFHWIFFGIIGAIAFFLYTAGVLTSPPEKPGLWSVNFLDQAVYPAQSQQIFQEEVLKDLAFASQQKVSSKSGFIDSSPCGEVDGIALWNKKEEWCNPPLAQNLEKIFKNKLEEKNMLAQYTEIKVLGKKMIGKGKPITYSASITPIMKYTYDSSFTIDLSAFFQEFSQVQSEAQSLVRKCSTQKDLPGCVKKEISVNWHYLSCDVITEIPPDQRTLSFCISAPLGKRYWLALDFNPATSFSIEGSTLVNNAESNAFELSFPAQENSISYQIYLTDYIDVKHKKGSSSLLSAEVLPPYFLEKRTIQANDIVSDESACTSGGTKTLNKAYSCGSLILYVLDKSTLTTFSGSYLLAVTSLIDQQESTISEWLQSS